MSNAICRSHRNKNQCLAALSRVKDHSRTGPRLSVVSGVRVPKKKMPWPQSSPYRGAFGAKWTLRLTAMPRRPGQQRAAGPAGTIWLRSDRTFRV